MRLLLALFLLIPMTAVPAPKVVNIDFHDSVNYVSAALLIAQIEASQGAESIVIDIDSGGGSVPAGWLIVEAIEKSVTPVTCRVSGISGSMAHVILQACDIRQMVRGTSVLMIHNLSVSGVSGTPDDIQELATAMKTENDKLLLYELLRSNLTPDFVRNLIPGSKMLWVDATQAKAWGLIDEIL
jgi:ATP-dependent Clp protease protease subunit